MRGPTQHVLSNVMLLGVGEVLARVIAFAGTAYVTRTLGAEGFGMVGFGAVVCGYFALVNLGLNDIGTREVARDPLQAARFGASVIAVKLILALLLWPVLAVAAWSLDKSPLASVVILLSGLSLFSTGADSAWALRGLQRNGYVAVAMAAGQGVFVLAAVLLVRSAEDVIWVPVAQVLGEAFAALLLARALFRGRDGRVDLRLGFYTLRSAGFAIISRLLRTVVLSFGVVLIGFFSTDRDVGLYTAAQRMCLLLLAVAGTLNVAYLPAFSEIAVRQRTQLPDVFGRGIEFATAVGAPLVIGGIVLAEPLLRVLFGAEFGDAAPAFRLLLVGIALIFVQAPLRNVLLAVDRTRAEMNVIAVAAAVTVVGSVIAIPRLGFTGAALAVVLAESVALLGSVLATRDLHLWGKCGRAWRPLAAAITMGGAVHGITAEMNVLLRVASGMLIYVAVLVAIRGVPRDVHLRRSTAEVPAANGLGVPRDGGG